jgi:hypothetical protein
MTSAIAERTYTAHDLLTFPHADRYELLRGKPRPPVERLV